MTRTKSCLMFLKAQPIPRAEHHERPARVPRFFTLEPSLEHSFLASALQTFGFGPATSALIVACRLKANLAVMQR